MKLMHEKLIARMIKEKFGWSGKNETWFVDRDNYKPIISYFTNYLLLSLIGGECCLEEPIGEGL